MSVHNPKSIYQFSRIITDAFNTTKEGQFSRVLIHEEEKNGGRTLIDYALKQIEVPQMVLKSIIPFKSMSLNGFISDFIQQLSGDIDSYTHMSNPAERMLINAKEEDREEVLVKLMGQLVHDLIDLGRPVVWVIHNLQWAESSIIKFLEVLTHSEDLPLLLVMDYYREDYELSLTIDEYCTLTPLNYDKLQDVQISVTGLANVHYLKFKVHKDSLKYEEAIEEAIKGLKVLGIRIRKKPTVMDNLKVINRLKGRLSPRKLKKLQNKPAVFDEEDLLIKAFLTELCSIGIDYDDDFLYAVLLKLSLVASKGSVDDYTALALTGYVLMSLHFLEEDRNVDHYQETIFHLLDQCKDAQIQSLTRYINGTHIYHNYSKMTQTIDIMEFVRRTAIQHGDWSLFARATLRVLDCYMIKGQDTQLTLAQVESLKGAAEACGLVDVASVLVFYEEAVRLLARGNSDDLADSLLFAESIEPLSDVHKMTLQLLRVKVAQSFAKFNLSEQALQETAKLKKYVGTYFMSHFIEQYEGAQIGLKWLKEGSSKQISKLNRLNQIQKIQGFKVEINPDLFGSGYKLIAGMAHMVPGEEDLAIEQLESGLELAKEDHMLEAYALISEVLCLFSKRTGLEKSELYYGIQTYEAYKSLNYVNKTSHYNDLYKVEVEAEVALNRWQEVKPAANLNEVILAYERIMKAKDKMQLKTAFFDQVNRVIEPSKSRLILEENLVYTIDQALVSDRIGLDIENVTDESKKVVKHVLHDSETVLVNLERLHPIATYDAYIMDSRDVCILCLPILYQSIIVGALYFERSSNFTDQDQAFCQALAEKFGYQLYRGEGIEERQHILAGIGQEISALLRFGESHKSICDHLQLNHKQLENHFKEIYKELDVVNHGELMNKIVD